MSAPQAAAITACTACAAVGGAAAGGAFSSSETSLNTDVQEEHDHSKEGEGLSEKDVPQAQETPVTYTILSEESSTRSSDYGEGKVGKKYEDFLAGTYGKANDQNQNWWNKKYEEYKKVLADNTEKAKLSTEFGENKVTQAFDSSQGQVNTALNKVCDSIYKKNTTDVDSEDTAKQKTKTDLWRFCSQFDKAPKNLKDQKDENTAADTIGKAKEEELLSTTSEDNNKYWEYKNSQFQALSAAPTAEIFKDHYVKNKEDPGNKSLKEACKQGYQAKTTKEVSKPSQDDVVKYCSFKKIS